jgi:hypothetical protein
MKETFKIRGICKIGNETMPCSGVLQIGDSDLWNIPITWRIYKEDGTVLAFSGRKIYLGNRTLSRDDLLKEVVKDIENYRSERKRLFSQVEIY